MEMTRLGPDGPLVSRIGFGCWQLGGHGWGAIEEEAIIKAVHDALDAGVNFFDTADVYGLGRSEELLGAALAGHGDDVVIATKGGVSWDRSGRVGRDASPAYIRQAVDASLMRLGISRIPLYQVHWPDPATPVGDTIAALVECRRAGKISHIGCSNFNAEQLREARGAGEIIALQSPYSLLNRAVEDAVLPYCREAGLGFIAYQTLTRGLLTGKYDAATRFGPDDSRSRDLEFKIENITANLEVVDRLKDIAASYGRTPAQLAIRWVLERDGVSLALAGIKNPAQLAENTGALGWSLSEADHRLLADITETTAKGGHS